MCAAAAIALAIPRGLSAARVQGPTADAARIAALSADGDVIYMRDCASCHGSEGTSDGAGPALAGNTNLANRTHVIERILGGSAAKGMEAFGKTLSDHDVAAVATFVRNAWDNDDGLVVESDVAPIRATLKIAVPK